MYSGTAASASSHERAQRDKVGRAQETEENGDSIPAPASPAGSLCPSPYSEETDLWSLGVILYALSFSRLPYASSTAESLYAEIVRAPLHIPSSPRRSADLVALVKRLLSIDPQHRPDCEHILAHPAIVRRREDRRRQADGQQRGDRQRSDVDPLSPSAETQQGEIGTTSALADAIALAPLPPLLIPAVSPPASPSPQSSSPGVAQTALIVRPSSQRRGRVAAVTGSASMDTTGFALPPSSVLDAQGPVSALALLTLSAAPSPEERPSPSSAPLSSPTLSGHRLAIRLSPPLLVELALHSASTLVHIVCSVLYVASSTAVSVGPNRAAALLSGLAMDLCPVLALSAFCIGSTLRAHTDEAGEREGQQRRGAVGASSRLRRWCWSLPARGMAAAVLALYSSRGLGGAPTHPGTTTALALSIAVLLAATLV